MNGHAMRTLAGVFCLAALATVAGAAPVQHSSSFLYRYEQDVGSHTQDLDGNATADFWPSNAGELPAMAGGIATFQSGDFYRTDFGSSITRAQFPLDDGDYTIEIRAKIGRTGTEGTLGTMGVFWRDLDNSINVTYLSRTGQSYNEGGTIVSLGANDNTGDFHTYRMTRQNQQVWVWRDEQLLNPGGAPLTEAAAGGSQGFFLGDTSGTGNNGDWELDYVRLTPGAYAPGPAIGQPYAWYQADNGPLNAAGAPAAAGEAVRTWQDVSGNGRDLDRVSGAGAPTLQAGGVNGQPAVDFADNTAIWAASSDWGVLSQPSTIFVVAALDAKAGDYLFDSSSSAGRNALFAGQSSNPDDWQMYAGSVLASDPFVLDEFQIHSLVFDGASSAHWIDGGLSAMGDVGSQSLAGLVLGGRYSASQLLDGQIAEVIVYDGVLDASQRRAVEEYLSAKYGRSLIPEPATMLLTLLGVGAVAARGRRRRA